MHLIAQCRTAVSVSSLTPLQQHGFCFIPFQILGILAKKFKVDWWEGGRRKQVDSGWYGNLVCNLKAIYTVLGMHNRDMCIPIKMLSTRAKMLFIDYVQHFGGFHIKALREGVFGVKHSVLSISWAALFIQVTLKSPPIETYLARPCRFSVSPRSTGNHSPSLGTEVAHHDVLSRSAPWKMLDHQVTISGENFSVLIILIYFISFFCTTSCVCLPEAVYLCFYFVASGRPHGAILRKRSVHEFKLCGRQVVECLSSCWITEELLMSKQHQSWNIRAHAGLFSLKMGFKIIRGDISLTFMR